MAQETIRTDSYTTSLSDENLLAQIAEFRSAMEAYQRYVQHLENEALARMERNGATSIPSEQFICEVQRRDTYDQAGFSPLKEILNEKDLASCWTAEHQVLQVMPESWVTVKVKALAARYGAPALAIVERAKVPGRATLKFAKRE